MSDPRRLRRGAVTGLALAGCAACATAGGAPLVIGACVALLVVLGRRQARTPSARASSLWRLGNASALIGAVVGGIAGAPVLYLGVGLVGWLLVHRAWTGSRAADDRVTLLLSLLLLLLACILSLSFALVPIFIAFALLSPVALALTHLGVESESGLERERLGPRGPLPPLVPLGLASLVLAAVLFVLTPRTDRPGGILAMERSLKVAGYGDEVVVGEDGAIADNPQVVLRMKLSGDAGVGPWYVRGTALDTFDGRRWTRTETGAVRVRSRAPPKDALRQEILQEPLPEPVIFGVPELVAFSGFDEPVARDVGGGLRLTSGPRSLSYVVYSLPERPDPARLTRAVPDPRFGALSRAEFQLASEGLWTRLPEDLDGRIAALATQVIEASAAGEGAYSRASALERFLRREFTYVETLPAAQSGQSLSDFLLVSRTGHCEYFATGLAVMLRTQGIPARVVTGFLGGEWNAIGDYLVFRQQDAHAWVEVNLGEEGWVRLDGTPAADALPDQAWAGGQALDWARSGWTRLILEYDLSDQIAVALALAGSGTGPGGELKPPSGGGLLLLGALIGLVLGGRAALSVLAGERGRRRRPRSALTVLHQRARRRVARKGWEIPDALPPVAAAQWLVAQAGEGARPLETLAWLLYRGRYGGEDEAALLSQARAALAALSKLDRPRPPVAGAQDPG